MLKSLIRSSKTKYHISLGSAGSMCSQLCASSDSLLLVIGMGPSVLKVLLFAPLNQDIQEEISLVYSSVYLFQR